jgi:hypothetical protein
VRVSQFSLFGSFGSLLFQPDGACFSVEVPFASVPVCAWDMLAVVKMTSPTTPERTAAIAWFFNVGKYFMVFLL